MYKHGILACALLLAACGSSAPAPGGTTAEAPSGAVSASTDTAGSAVEAQGASTQLQTEISEQPAACVPYVPEPEPDFNAFCRESLSRTDYWAGWDEARRAQEVNECIPPSRMLWNDQQQQLRDTAEHC